MKNPNFMKQTLANKKHATFVVLDSGLGGLAVTAELTARLEINHYFPEANVIFYNALFDNDSGYNRLSSAAEKFEQFDRALNGLTQYCQPDILLIACNTLSVLYANTNFAKKAKFPVCGIIEAGVNLIAQSLNTHPQAKVIIFATPTTIDSNDHRSGLQALGFHHSRVIGQPCLELVDSLERGWDSLESQRLIQDYVDQALQQLDDISSPLFVSLNCTHYAYGLKWWQLAFEKRNRKLQAILNPNTSMLNFLSNMHGLPTHSNVTVKIVSKVSFLPESIRQIGKLLGVISAKTEQAFQQYILKPDLF